MGCSKLVLLHLLMRYYGVYDLFDLFELFVIYYKLIPELGTPLDPQAPLDT